LQKKLPPPPTTRCGKKNNPVPSKGTNEKIKNNKKDGCRVFFAKVFYILLQFRPNKIVISYLKKCGFWKSAARGATNASRGKLKTLPKPTFPRTFLTVIVYHPRTGLEKGFSIPRLEKGLSRPVLAK
jgi:hypothetical protein